MAKSSTLSQRGGNQRLGRALDPEDQLITDMSYVMDTENQRPGRALDSEDQLILIKDMSYLSVLPSGSPNNRSMSINDDVDTIFTELDEGIEDWRLFWDGTGLPSFPKDDSGDDEHMLLEAMEQGIIP